MYTWVNTHAKYKRIVPWVSVHYSIHANDTCIYTFIDVGNCSVSNES